MALFGLTPSESWLLELRQFNALAGVHEEAERAADYRAGVVAALLANAHRKQGATALTPATFFPSLEEVEAEEGPEMTPEETKAFLRGMMRALGGKPVRRAEA